jgi:hypothetical protein
MPHLMILSSRTLPAYLMDRGLLSPAEVVDGDVSIANLSRRNRNFRVIRGARPGLFIKQPHDWEPFSADTLRREASCYTLARDDEGFAALGPLLPRFVDFDAASSVLVLELLPSDETLGDYHRRLGHFPLEMARALGGMLGRYHRGAGAQRADAAATGVFPRSLPWILDAVNRNPSHIGPVSGGNQEMARILAQYPQYGAALDAVRAGWRHEALVHGDMKWENCVVLPDDGPGGLPGLRIVDWELADFGDPCWDVGSLFQAYLSFWILSIDGADHLPVQDLPGFARFPLERMQPAMAAFWSTYVDTLGADPAEAEDRLRRSALYAAARMIQTAWEYSAAQPRLTPNLLAILQVAMNVLLRPDDAVRQLLGISPRSAA